MIRLFPVLQIDSTGISAGILSRLLSLSCEVVFNGEESESTLPGDVNFILLLQASYGNPVVVSILRFRLEALNSNLA